VVASVKFSFIKESRIEFNSTVMQNLATSSSNYKKPSSFKVLYEKPEYEGGDSTYYLYTSIGGMVVTHMLFYSDLIENTKKLKDYNNQASVHATSGGESFFKNPIGADSIFG
jgi:hypothetical protein